MWINDHSITRSLPLQATYQAHDLRPRSTKRPPPSPRDHNPPPMTFSTNQRTDFVPKDMGARAKIIEPVSSVMKNLSDKDQILSCHED